jgi:cytochrome c-type biogenesis protein CcmH/NrfG
MMDQARRQRFRFRLRTLLLVVAILALLLVVIVQQVQIERIRRLVDARERETAIQNDALTALIRGLRDHLDRSSR